MKKVDEGCDLFDEIYLKGKPLWSWIVGLELAAVILDFDKYEAAAICSPHRLFVIWQSEKADFHCFR